MASWSEIEADAPDLAARARALFDAHVHKTLATVRRDGSPRISGTEVRFAHGDLCIGSMGQALKARDLQRDPRFTLHSGSDDPPAWQGDAKVAGRAEEVHDPEQRDAVLGGTPSPDEAHAFRLDITELVVTRLGDPADHLVIDSWHEGRGVASRTRR